MWHKRLIYAGAAGFAAAAALLSLCLGAANMGIGELWQALLSGPRGKAGFIFWYSRLPRTAACLLAGAALSVSGGVIQSVLHNRLASPSIIGVNAGAGLGVTLSCALGALSGWAIAGSAFLGAVGAMLLVVGIGRKTGASRTTVILAGVAVNAILNALAEGITSVLPEVAMLSVDFRVGGFASVSHTRLIPAGVLILVSLAALLSMGNELDVLALGDDTARSLGLPVRQLRTLLLALAALLAGAAVSFAGLLGFVGLIVPHAVRTVTGSDNRRLLPLCMLTGGAFVTLCDVAARMLFAPYELPVGILMSVIGGPVFLLLLLRKRGDRAHA